MRKVILQIMLEPSETSIAGVRRKLKLKSRQIDADFGVRLVRKEQKEYAVRVDADVAQRVRGESAATSEPGDIRVALVH
jgi:hypothetical protein